MKISSEVKIGIIVTIAIAATIWGLNYLKGRNLLTSVDHYSAVFDEIGGLEKNSKIFIHGYRVGQVGEIIFNSQEGGSLTVNIEIRKDFDIPMNSTIVLYDADFMGTKALQIDLSDSDIYHAPGDTLSTRIKSGLVQQLVQTRVARPLGDLQDQAAGVGRVGGQRFQFGPKPLDERVAVFDHHHTGVVTAEQAVGV